MSNWHQVNGFVRLGKDPEVRSFANGGKKTELWCAISNRVKNDKGEWVDDAIWISIEFWNSKNGGTLADRAAGLVKGQEIFVEAKLKMEKWTDKVTNAPRQVMKLTAHGFQYVGKKGDQPSGGGNQSGGSGHSEHEDKNSGGGGDNSGDDVPF